MPISEAKEFLFRELQELPIEPLGGHIHWTEDSDRIVFRLSNHCLHDETSIPLELGVTERIKSPTNHDGDGSNAVLTAHTCCVQFERGRGWHREQAEQWVARRLGLRDLGRTISLEPPPQGGTI